MTETKPHATLAASDGAHPAHTGAAASGLGAVTMDATPDAPVVPVWFLSAEELAATRAKLATITDRARRKGFTGEVLLDAKPATRVQHTPGGLAVTVHGFNVTITGEPPAYQGWRFVAAVDSVEGRTVLRLPPGVDENVRNTDITAGRCDHCHTTRDRRSTILVRHDDTGELLQVGRTCVKDFLGHDTSPVFLTVDDVRDTLARGLTRGDPAWDATSVIAYAHAAVQAFGWTPASTVTGQPTRDVVRTLLGHTQGADQLAAAIRPHLPEAQQLAPRIVADLLAGLTEPTGYEANLAAVLRAEAIPTPQLGLAVSAIPAHTRLTERAQAAAGPPADWLGAIGDKITVTGTVRTALRVDGYTRYSPDPLLVILECPGAVVKLTTTAGWSDTVHRGDTLTLTGTVKAHTEWNGTRQTVLSRAKPTVVSDAAAPGWERLPTSPGRRAPQPLPSLTPAPFPALNP